MKFENIGPAINASIKVGCYGKEKQCEGIGWHIHPEYEVVYIRNGRGLLNICTKQVPYQDGVLLFLGPEIPHTNFGNTDFEDGLEVVVQFPEEFVRQKIAVFPEFKGLQLLMEQSKFALLFTPAVKQYLGSLFEAMPEQSSSQRLLTFLECLRVMALPDSCQSLYGPSTLPLHFRSTEVQKMDHIFDLINRQYDQELSSSDMAKALGMTTNSFCRFFKAKIGKTFLQFLNEFRLERAKDLLLNSEESIQAIMYSCGFRDAPYFSRFFKSVVGQSPSNFRATTP